MKTIKVFPDLSEINKYAAEQFISIGNDSIKLNDRFTVSLAGGTTPVSFFQFLISDELKDQIDWTKVYFFFGDERDVSPISEKSNFRMANEILFDPLKISKSNIFRWHTEIINAVEVAQAYERTLSNFFNIAAGEFPSFDLILLGMGDDGHTASLFPFSPALKENKRIAVSNYVEKLDTNRLTFTFPTLNNARNIIFTVAGENKAPALKEVIEGNENCEKFPAQCVKPLKGKIFWLVDKKAANLLTD